MRKKVTNKFYIGLDAIDVNIKTDTVLPESYYCQKNEIGEEIWHLIANKSGYLLHICLPKVLRETNEIPFNTGDYGQIERVLKIREQMQILFENKTKEMVVRTAEVNATIQLSDKTKTAPMMKLLSCVLLTKGEKLFIACSGEKTGKRYSAVKNLCSGKKIESIKTDQLSNSRIKFKIYDKGIHQQEKEKTLSDKGLLRIEFIYSKRGLKVAKTGNTLEEFLTPDSINSLLEWYRKDYKTLLIDNYWNNKDRYSLDDEYNVPIYEEMITIIYNDLVANNGKPLAVALINKEIIEIDFELFRKACRRFYQKQNSAQKAWARVQKSGEIQINDGVIDEFVSFSKQIIYSE